MPPALDDAAYLAITSRCVFRTQFEPSTSSQTYEPEDDLLAIATPNVFVTERLPQVVSYD